MPEPTHFEAKFYALRKSKDGLIVSFVIHPNDAPNELITAPIGEQYIVALAPYVESRSAEQTQGDITQPAGRVLSPAEEAIKKAHTTYREHLEEIREVCDVPSCANFKTDPDALARFYQWEIMNGYVTEPRR